jgi:hypothetical protein
MNKELGPMNDCDFPLEKEIEHILSLPKLRLLSTYTVSIKPLASGCLVSVGCKDLAFSTLEEGLKEVNGYFDNPHEAYKKWFKILNQ